MRPLRIEFPGALYHVISRGNARQAIFLDAGDRERFLAVLAAVCERFSWRVHAYCLMGNHYHLLVETPRPNLARGMQQVGSNHAQGFNRRHGRVGHVLQGRYTAILVERETYLLELARYVVLNPVRAGVCASAGRWPWSSYRATAGLEAAPPFLFVDWILGQFGENLTVARRRYRAFVSEGVKDPVVEPSLGRLCAGSSGFVRRLVPDAPDRAEIVEAERDPLGASLREFLDAGQTRALVIAYRDHGYRLRELAKALGVHPSTVCRRLQRAEAALRCKV